MAVPYSLPLLIHALNILSEHSMPTITEGKCDPFPETFSLLALRKSSYRRARMIAVGEPSTYFLIPFAESVAAPLGIEHSFYRRRCRG